MSFKGEPEMGTAFWKPMSKVPFHDLVAFQIIFRFLNLEANCPLVMMYFQLEADLAVVISAMTV